VPESFRQLHRPVALLPPQKSGILPTDCHLGENWSLPNTASSPPRHPNNFTMSKQLQTLTINNLPIRLGQALKLADLVQDGFDARTRIQNGDVLVNGKVETRRGKKLTSGDTITIDGQTRVIGSST
jgi:ribosome-associated protein